MFLALRVLLSAQIRAVTAQPHVAHVQTGFATYYASSFEGCRTASATTFHCHRSAAAP
jgi:rare lipoprotein A (peptidoglycan hydrolase)